MTQLRVSPYPIPELAEFLRPYRACFYRVESLETLERYVTGLLTDLNRKSGARVAQAVAGLSQSAVYRLLGQTRWDEVDFNRQRVATMVKQATAGDGMINVDDSGFPRKGEHSVGVAVQYCGQLGKTANCQVVVTAEYVDPYYAWPVTGRLYLPQSWAEDEQRRQRAAIPAEVRFQTKPQIALTLIDEAQAAGVPFKVVGGDSGYGDNPTFLDGLEERQVACVVGVSSNFGVQPLAEQCTEEPAPPVRRADQLIADQDEEQWQTITWRMGQDGPLTKEFTAVRCQRTWGEPEDPTGWLIGERAVGQGEVESYYWSNLPSETPLARLAELAHRRPGIERRYQDGKNLTGLGHYPARLWHSFHRHLVIDMLTISWLLLQEPASQKGEIAPEPAAVDDPEQPFFPLRPGAVSECRSSQGTSLSLFVW